MVPNSASTNSGGSQLSDVAMLSNNGRRAAIHVPTYGRYRSSAARNPHSSAYGIPMINRPIDKTIPNDAFPTACTRRKRLMR